MCRFVQSVIVCIVYLDFCVNGRCLISVEVFVHTFELQVIDLSYHPQLHYMDNCTGKRCKQQTLDVIYCLLEVKNFKALAQSAVHTLETSPQHLLFLSFINILFVSCICR